MKPAPGVEDLRLWAVVTATVRPLKPHAAPPPPAPVARPAARPDSPLPAAAPPPRPAVRAPHAFPEPRPPADVEAGLRRRLQRGRDALVARIDLHGLNQEAARAALTAFIRRAVDEGWRSALVITGKGVSGDGVLRRRVPDWLADPPIREYVAGVSEAHRRHGGEGALYVALKRKG